MQRNTQTGLLEDCTESVILDSAEAFGEVRSWPALKSHNPMTDWPAAEIGETVQQVISKYLQSQGIDDADMSYKVDLEVIGTHTQQNSDWVTSEALGAFIAASKPASNTSAECVGVITASQPDGTHHKFDFEVVPGQEQALRFPQNWVENQCRETSWPNESLSKGPHDWDLVPLPVDWPPSAREAEDDHMMSGALSAGTETVEERIATETAPGGAAPSSGGRPSKRQSFLSIFK